MTCKVKGKILLAESNNLRIWEEDSLENLLQRKIIVLLSSPYLYVVEVFTHCGSQPPTCLAMTLTSCVRRLSSCLPLWTDRAYLGSQEGITWVKANDFKTGLQKTLWFVPHLLLNHSLGGKPAAMLGRHSSNLIAQCPKAGNWGLPAAM